MKIGELNERGVHENPDVWKNVCILRFPPEFV